MGRSLVRDATSICFSWPSVKTNIVKQTTLAWILMKRLFWGTDFDRKNALWPKKRTKEFKNVPFNAQRVNEHFKKENLKIRMQEV